MSHYSINHKDNKQLALSMVSPTTSSDGSMDRSTSSVGTENSEIFSSNSGIHPPKSRPEEEEEPTGSHWRRVLDSFKPYDMEAIDLGEHLTELEKAAIATSTSPLSRGLKQRHLQMISIGGSIGAGLFVGSGEALSTSGPAGVLISYIFVGLMMYTVMQALAELAVAFPVSGAFVTYNYLFLDFSWGFAMAWNYALQWLIVLPLELVAASLTITYWDSEINNVAWVSIFYVLIMLINLFGVKGYGEIEYFFSLIKVVAVVGFIILGIILVCGGAPHTKYIGGEHWHNPGAFNNSFKGFCSVFTVAAFSFAGTELAGLAAAETQNPSKSIPKAIKRVFWRIALFYVVAITLVGLLVPFTDSRLLSADSSIDIKASPFVIAINNARINVLPHIMNAVILITVISVGNSSVYGSSRTLAALGALKQAPASFAYIDREGRPLVGIAVQGVVGLLCFVSASPKQSDVFDWLLALSALSILFTWMSICLCHIRFRHALYSRGRGTDELAFVAQTGIWGSYFGAIANILVLIAQFWVALFPIGSPANAESFFKVYLAFPIILMMYAGHKIYTRNWSWYLKTDEIDIDTGRRDIDLELLKQEIAEDRLQLSQKPFYYKLINFFW